MAKYRKRPVEVEAMRLCFDPWPEWFVQASESGNTAKEFGYPLKTGMIVLHYDPATRSQLSHATVYTRFGPIAVQRGMWIVKGVNGDLHAVTDDSFEWNYDRIPD